MALFNIYIGRLDAEMAIWRDMYERTWPEARFNYHIYYDEICVMRGPRINYLWYIKSICLKCPKIER